MTNKIFPRKREENGATNRLFRQEDNMKHKTLVCLALVMMLENFLLISASTILIAAGETLSILAIFSTT